MSILTKIFGTKKDKDLKHLQPIVDKVNSFEPWAKGLKDEDFPLQTQKFRERLKNGETLDQILPEAFALVREASFRVLGERHYDVQIMGAIVLHEGKILELKTGEGKTLTSVPAGYLNALEGKGVHIVTVNDYLAERDANWMGPVYKFLGLSVGVIKSGMYTVARQDAYRCDITYGTNKEFGFDYLRDNCFVYNLKDKVQTGFHYCIIDEIDSVLIDEARTPLIISGEPDDTTNIKSINAQKIVKYFVECEKDPETGDYPVISSLARFKKKYGDETVQLEPKGDYMLDEKSKRVRFTTEGLLHMEKLLNQFGIIKGSLYGDEKVEDESNPESNENFDYVHYVTQAMVANHLYHKDVDYVVSEDKQIQIIDEFTGRILHGRRYSDGLHEAIEAKEGTPVKSKLSTKATITLQNYFKMYEKLSGMTGTADTEALEFNKIYNLDVVVIPTHLPVIREDLVDRVYFNEGLKLKSICQEVNRIHETGQPILIGTISIEKSELISKMLTAMGIKHEVLNAKNHAKEAAIIENAGSKGAVTVATNMAGRGTDIKLGGSPDALARKLCGTEATEEELKIAREKTHEQWKAQYEEVKALGGLYIIGSERHESRRIDNQLRGRSGRQGDPGTSQFYVSFDDSVIRLNGRDGIKSILNSVGNRVGMENIPPLEFQFVSNFIEKSQRRAEERNFEVRKHLLEYDDFLNEQRQFIYSQRNEIMADENIIQRFLATCDDYIDYCVEKSINKHDECDIQILHQELLNDIGYNYTPEAEDETMPSEKLSEKIKQNIEGIIQSKIASLSSDFVSAAIRTIYLQQIDSKWQIHLDQLDDLKEAVNLRSFAQKNPLVEYKLEGSDLFDEMINKIKCDVAKTALTKQLRIPVTIRVKDPSSQGIAVHREFLTNEEIIDLQKAQIAARQKPATPFVRPDRKIGRNEPCPCGSGKKYKNCCGRNLSAGV